MDATFRKRSAHTLFYKPGPFGLFGLLFFTSPPDLQDFNFSESYTEFLKYVFHKVTRKSSTGTAELNILHKNRGDLSVRESPAEADQLGGRSQKEESWMTFRLILVDIVYFNK